MTKHTFSRRQVLAGGLTGAAALGLSGLADQRAAGADTIHRAVAAAKSGGGSLADIKHVVFLMQENRSFDHYFGAMKPKSKVHGFQDTNNAQAFSQAWPGGSAPKLLPFHMDTVSGQGECTYDLDHGWQAEHLTWNNGAMDSFVSTHTSAAFEGSLGTNTMGYYEAADIPFYYDLAQQFTLCDAYHCSVLGPTHPNRLMQISGTIDPAGIAGGPILATNDFLSQFQGTCSWETMPEILSAAGITWKHYNPSGPNYQPGASYFFSKNMLLYFDQFVSDPTSDLYDRAFNYTGTQVSGGYSLTAPGTDDFAADVANGTLPQVSWIISPDGYDEHPPAPAALGEWYTQQVLNTLLSNPEVWASTVLFVMYDENDGFFDHVPPPVPPTGTAGEYLTVDPLPADASGIAGPIGLGVRVPMIVVSPFSVGGHVVSEVFDHTSQLKFLEKVFNVTAPNISEWRRQTVGDLTSTLTSLAKPKTGIPTLVTTSDDVTAAPIANECSFEQEVELNPSVAPYPVPTKQKMPKQNQAYTA